MGALSGTVIVAVGIVVRPSLAASIHPHHLRGDDPLYEEDAMVLPGCLAESQAE